MNSELKQQIDVAIAKNQPIRARIFGLLSSSEEEINYILTSILKKYAKEDCIGTLYTCVKEVALNGTKANIKRVLFHELNINSEDEADYSRGMAIFKEKLNEEYIYEYALKAKHYNLYVDLRFEFDANHIQVEAINNSPISDREDERIRSKFQKSVAYNDLAEFYMDNSDSTEGAGLGITLILMLLKAEGIDPHSFRIYSDKQTKTVARIEYPLSSDYKFQRDSFEGEKKNHKELIDIS